MTLLYSILVETDVHAYGNMWMNPWGWTRAQAPDYVAAKRCGDATRDAIRGVNGLVRTPFLLVMATSVFRAAHIPMPKKCSIVRAWFPLASN